MEALGDEKWDVVIAGTGLAQSLLALSLSRSGLRILHIDRNHYYGGSDAGLSLEEANQWANEHRENGNALFSDAQIKPHPSTISKLKPSRSYTLSLNPQIIYATGPLLPQLVTSRVQNQLDFLAVGSSWICKDGELQKIPTTREDVFADESLTRRDKMGLMKLLRHVVQDDDAEGGEEEVAADATFQTVLTSKFKIAPQLQAPISALALTQHHRSVTPFGVAVSRIRRHMKSMNYYGPGFAAVCPKYGGNAEIAQVACRACAVYGAVYLLGHGIGTVQIGHDNADRKETSVVVQLTNGTTVRTKHLLGGILDIPEEACAISVSDTDVVTRQARSITIVADPLQDLFQITADNGPKPAVAIVLAHDEPAENPVYLQIHSEDTGDCPRDQCVIYASLTIETQSSHAQGAATEQAKRGQQHLEQAVLKFLKSVGSRNSGTPPGPTPSQIGTSEPASTSSAQKISHETTIDILWSMSYTTYGREPVSQAGTDRHQTPQRFARSVSIDESGRIMVFQPPVQDLAFRDDVVADVREVWEKILRGNQADGKGDTWDEAGEFMVFDDRNEGTQS